MAMIATYGLRIVGTKYLPPMLPTDDTLKVESAKSSAVNLFAAVRSINDFRSASIFRIDLF
jgi:hypothetical protein